MDAFLLGHAVHESPSQHHSRDYRACKWSIQRATLKMVSGFKMAKFEFKLTVHYGLWEKYPVVYP